MSVLRLGATKKYSDNWDNIFSGKRGSTSKTKAAGPARKSAKKTAKAAKKSAPKKRGAKKRK
jgi:hypothetical protein